MRIAAACITHALFAYVLVGIFHIVTDHPDAPVWPAVIIAAAGAALIIGLMTEREQQQ